MYALLIASNENIRGLGFVMESWSWWCIEGISGQNLLKKGKCHMTMRLTWYENGNPCDICGKKVELSCSRSIILKGFWEDSPLKMQFFQLIAKCHIFFRWVCMTPSSWSRAQGVMLWFLTASCCIIGWKYFTSLSWRSPASGAPQHSPFLGS